MLRLDPTFSTKRLDRLSIQSNISRHIAAAYRPDNESQDSSIMSWVEEAHGGEGDRGKQKGC